MINYNNIYVIKYVFWTWGAWHMFVSIRLVAAAIMYISRCPSLAKMQWKYLEKVHHFKYLDGQAWRIQKTWKQRSRRTCVQHG